MTKNYEFTNTFVFSALMHDPAYFAKWADYIKASEFDTVQGAIIERIKTLRPTKAMLVVAIKDSGLHQGELEAALKIANNIPSADELSQVSAKYLTEATLEVIRENSFRHHVAKSLAANHERRIEHIRAAADAAEFDPGDNSDAVDFETFATNHKKTDYLIDGIFKCGFLYGMTGKTGSGKTVVCLELARLVAQGVALGDHEITKPDTVVYLAGENPNDVSERCSALWEGHGPADIIFYPVAGRPAAEKAVRELVRNGKNIAMVIVDTSTAFFDGEDENSNLECLRHAKWLRSISERVPGNPTVLVACHPNRAAADDNMIPRGGSAFLNELDGNLSCVKQGELTVLEQCGKYRGVDFGKIAFKRSVAYPRTLGGKMPTVIGRHITEAEYNQETFDMSRDEKAVLKLLHENPGIPRSDLARKQLWFNSKNEPDKSKVQRLTERLRKNKAIDSSNHLTALGMAVLFGGEDHDNDNDHRAVGGMPPHSGFTNGKARNFMDVVWK